MKPLLRRFGVIEGKTSPFCKPFQSKTYLCEEFESFIPKQTKDNESKDSDDIENQEEEIAMSELTRLSQIKDLIMKVTDANQSNAVDSEISIKEDGVDIENNFRSDHFSGVDHITNFSTLKALLNCKSLLEVSVVTLDSASNLEFGKRDAGSTSIESKLMSLNQRYFFKQRIKRFERKQRNVDWQARY